MSDPAKVIVYGAYDRHNYGDLLFAIANLARHLKIDPEEALRQANKKFERRFRAIETEPGFESLSLKEKESLWSKAKAAQSD